MRQQLKYDFEEIYREHFHVVYMYVLGLSGDCKIAEDIAQESFARAIKHINRFRGECDMKTWLCRIARNEYYSYCKRHRRECVIDDLESLSEKDSGVVFEEMSENEEAADRIHEILHNLPEPYKEVFSLRVFGGNAWRRGKGFCGRTYFRLFKMFARIGGFQQKDHASHNDK